MTKTEAAKQAAKQSKGSQAFVVWVFDEGRNVYSAEQTKLYAPLVQIEAAYINGVMVAQC